jgi:hypothetical protein
MSRQIVPRMCWFAAASVSMLIAAPHLAEAGEITYAIQNYPADQQGATLSGTITTDGVIGTLAATDILSWSWTITPAGGTPSTVTSSDAGAEAFSVGSIVASQSAITIAPTGSTDDSALALDVVERERLISGLLYDRPGISGMPSTYDGTDDDSVVWNTPNPAMGGTDPWAIAEVATVPEPSSLTLAALAVTCAVALGEARKRRRLRRRPAVEAPAEIRAWFRGHRCCLVDQSFQLPVG